MTLRTDVHQCRLVLVNRNIVSCNNCCLRNRAHCTNIETRSPALNEGTNSDAPGLKVKVDALGLSGMLGQPRTGGRLSGPPGLRQTLPTGTTHALHTPSRRCFLSALAAACAMTPRQNKKLRNLVIIHRCASDMNTSTTARVAPRLFPQHPSGPSRPFAPAECDRYPAAHHVCGDAVASARKRYDSQRTVRPSPGHLSAKFC